MKRTRKNKRIRKLPEPKFLPSKRKEVGVVNVKYQEEFARHAYYFTLMGCTLVQLAQVFEVTVETINTWQNKYPKFRKAIIKGRDLADAKVAKALYEAALGYSHPDKVIISNKQREFDSKGRTIREWVEPLEVDTVKHYPPNVTAAIKWLKARQPEVWSDRVEVKGNITMHHQVDLSQFSIEELEVLSKLGQGEVEDVDFEEQ
jgi:hypothetical protein